MPHRKGAMLVPTTGSWWIAMISGFVRISTISVEIADSCVVQSSSVGVQCGRGGEDMLTLVPMRSGDLKSAQAVQCDLFSS